MTRAQLRKLFKRHHGSIKRVASKAGVTSVAVTRWLKGESESVCRIEPIALAEAKELVSLEARNNAMREDIALALGNRIAAA
jgi:transcriptional regulator with XRE-family HTH domain